MKTYSVYHARSKGMVADYINITRDNGLAKRLSIENPSLFILEMEYEYVAMVHSDVTVEDGVLAIVCQMTNHIPSNWAENEDVIVFGDHPKRSTSVGDIIIDNQTRNVYIVEPIGFRKLGE